MRGRQSSARQPRSQALWVHAQEARSESEKLGEEFALLLAEAALLLEEAALVGGASHRLWRSATSDVAGWESPSRSGGRGGPIRRTPC
jgi:hypothetical protein